MPIRQAAIFLITNVDWAKNNWAANVAFRWTDSMVLAGGTETVDSAMFTDVRVSYSPSWQDNAWNFAIGANNVFDEDPPVCFPCGVIGMSIAVHDLPGTVGYFRVSFNAE